MRIAFVTPEPWTIGGMPGVATQMARGLVAAGHDVDCFVTGDPAAVGGVDLVSREHLCVVDPGFRHRRWYSRRSLTAYGAELGLRAVASYDLARVLVTSHRRRPYDVVYRHSTIELHGLARHLPALPPVVVGPGVHAAGELRWLRRESALAARCTPRWRNEAVRAAYTVRARVQARDLRRVAGVISPSRVFRDELVDDCRLDDTRVRVVPFPVAIDAFEPGSGAFVPGGDHPLEVLYAGRIAVRKGIDTVVALSHRLQDLAGRVGLRVVGYPSSFSDYRPLLGDLDPTVAHFDDLRPAGAMPALFAAADVALVPSRYEPFGLTAAEALASGTPVVGTTAVGALEGVGAPACRVVEPDDLDGMEWAIRDLVTRIERGEAPELRRAARVEAERRFDPTAVVAAFADALAGLVAAAPTPAPGGRG